MLKDSIFWWEFIKAVVIVFGPILVVIFLVTLFVRWLHNKIQTKYDVLEGESFLEASDQTIAEKLEEMRNELDGYRSPREKDAGGQLPRDPDGSGSGWSGHHGRLDGEGSDPS